MDILDKKYKFLQSLPEKYAKFTPEEEEENQRIKDFYELINKKQNKNINEDKKSDKSDYFDLSNNTKKQLQIYLDPKKSIETIEN